MVTLAPGARPRVPNTPDLVKRLLCEDSGAIGDCDIGDKDRRIGAGRGITTLRVSSISLTTLNADGSGRGFAGQAVIRT